MNDELKRILEEAVVAYSTVLSQYFPVGTDNKDETPLDSLISVRI
jgi:hypothetical protein